jgi:hypothetical protein
MSDDNPASVPADTSNIPASTPADFSILPAPSSSWPPSAAFTDSSPESPQTPKAPSSTTSAASVPLPPNILSGWTRRGNPSPRRVAAPTSLGAIDEDTLNVAPDIPPRAQQRQISRVLNFGFTPTLHASRQPPAYTEYSDVKGPNGELLSEVRRKTAQPRRGGWRRLMAFAVIPIAVIIALGVGLGVGLTRNKSSGNGYVKPQNCNHFC